MHWLLLLAAAAFPQEIGNRAWQLFHVPEDGSYGLYVDSSSVEARGDARTAWIKNDRLSVDEHGVIRTVQLTRFDCAARTATVLILYEYGAGGELSDHFEIPQDRQRAEAVRSGSADDAALAHLCAPAVSAPEAGV